MLARKLIGVTFGLSFIFCGIAQAQSARGGGVAPAATVSRERRADIGRLLELMNVYEEEKKAVEPLFDNFRRDAPHVPAHVWQELKKEFDAEFTREYILNSYAPLYARRFSAAEVKELIKFFASPSGRKMVEALPLIRQEAFVIGFERGQKLGQRIRERLRKEGYPLSET